MLIRKPAWVREVIPDSEEERLRTSGGDRPGPSMHNDVIEISSDEDDLPPLASTPKKGILRGSNKTQSGADRSPALVTFETPKRRNFLRSRIVQSSDSESEEEAVQVQTAILELSDSSDEIEFVQPKPATKSATKTPDSANPHIPETNRSEDEDDGAIFILNEPKGSSKPTRTPKKTPQGTLNTQADIQLGVDKHPNFEQTAPSTPNKSVSDIPPAPSHPSSRQKPSGTPRSGKKVLLAAEQEKRHEYAVSLFNDLNRTVFKNGLPEDTKLNWNKRLLTTAGRAKWHRSREGVQTAEIELAEKILDCEERIRNTLSHEMCHLASWIIDSEFKEGHGKFWKSWASKVMKMYPHIEISTRHNYDISYPFEWKCEQCDKIYGRFSKSIRPDECLCGVCKVGKLVPLFSTANRTPKTPKTSRMAAIKSQDSPCSIRQTDPDEDKQRETYFVDSDSDVEALGLALGATSIS